MSQPAASRRNDRLHSILPIHACGVRVPNSEGLLPTKESRKPNSHHLLTCRGSIEGKGYRVSRTSPDRLAMHVFYGEVTAGD